MITCTHCGSPAWLACAPGTEAEARDQGNVCILKPAPEIPLVAWCAAHVPGDGGRDGGAVLRVEVAR